MQQAVAALCGARRRLIYLVGAWLGLRLGLANPNPNPNPHPHPHPHPNTHPNPTQVGAGGIGKTGLAVAVAHYVRLRHAFRDGVLTPTLTLTVDAR